MKVTNNAITNKSTDFFNFPPYLNIDGLDESSPYRKIFE